MAMHNELFCPAIERFSPEGRAAVDKLKDFIRSTVGTALLEKQALMLAGLPQDQTDEGVADICRELAECLADDVRMSNLHIGFTIAASEIVRERIAQLQARGIGRA